MTISQLRKRFDREFGKFFNQYTRKLRGYAGGKPVRGPVMTFPRKVIDERIKSLLEIANEINVDTIGKGTFKDTYVAKWQWHLKGKGKTPKEWKEKFRDWYGSINPKYCVYIFWSFKGRCMYVGRTGTGVRGVRPQGHFEKYWFVQDVARVDVYVVKRKAYLKQAECLAWHIHSPVYNEYKPSNMRNAKPCPVCEREKLIDEELGRIFKPKNKK